MDFAIFTQLRGTSANQSLPNKETLVESVTMTGKVLQ